MSLLAAVLPLSLAISIGAPTARQQDDRHIADGTHVQVTTLWRSERGLDQYAQIFARIGDAVVAALPEIAGVPERASGAPLLPLAIHASPPDFRRALSGGEGGGRRKRGRKVKGAADDGAATDATPVPISRRGDPAAGGTLLATAPKLEDRLMFVTGPQPIARWAIAVEAAHAGLYAEPHPDGPDAAARDGAALVAAHAGLAATGFARPELHQDPYTSTGLATLREQLLAVPADERPKALLRIAAEPPLDHLEFTATGPFAATAAEAARALLHVGSRSADGASPDAAARAVWAVGHLASHPPVWSLEAGSVGAHEFGWQVVAPRRSDALVLSADPMGERPFTLRTSFVIFSNDLTSPAQADIVLGDFHGDRYLLACNTVEGIYLFHRPGHGQPYETVTELKEVTVPAGRAVEVVVRWDGKELAINVGGADLAKQVLEAGAMSGRYGFGAHANVSALFSELVIE